MGALSYWYRVPYQPDVQAALDALREREFRAGRYHPVIPHPHGSTESPGPAHASIDEAVRASDTDGTRSILDVERVDRLPGAGVASPLPPRILLEVYGTTKPTADDLDETMRFLEYLDRGRCVYFFVHDEDGARAEICFAGMSYD